MANQNNHKNFTYAIIGSGALGGLYGGMLANAGFEVHFLLHRDFEHVQENGFQVESHWGDFHLPAASIADRIHASPETMPACDVTIIGLKTTNNHLLSTLLPAPTADGGVVLVLQNGLGIESDAAAVVNQIGNQSNEASRVLTGCCFLCSNKIAPGHIRHLDQGRIVFGDWQDCDGLQRSEESKKTSLDRPKSISPIAKQIEADFHAAGIEAQTTDDMLLTRWRKLLWNIPFNGLSVILNASSKELIDDEDAARLARLLMLEVQRGAAACGVTIPDEMIEKTLEVTRTMVPYDSSMRLDYLANRPMEIESLFWAPVHAAANAGCEMPMTRALALQLGFLQRR
ncbi:2-dehydropantoate 2-reductase [Rubripirellula obstinata]|uniref:2-dehydropantoate 2-reductase n=1 Tax=Rubripirellula obstinata TaxID=406547 RepID=A0A5B1CRV0_9BACT|nr:2-dehydropantoate 2-reductase [Rubripirellula obstinata]KAA1262380.1 2-dehydropantoate 2-reductase [Rubripirellula obstinata]